MKQAIYYTLICSIMLLAPGCGRLIDWGKGTFYQGELLKEEYDLVCTYMRSVRIYDQFTTRGMFDVLWLSDPVRTIYTNLHSSRRGKAEEYKQTFLRRQLEENNHYISFYVLTLYEDPLGDSESEWSLFLDIEGNYYMPLEIKAVELPYEFRVFFDDKYSRFKSAYVVKFSAKSVEEKPIITPETKQVVLHVRSIDREALLTWKFDAQGKVLPEQKYYGVKEKKKKAAARKFRSKS